MKENGTTPGGDAKVNGSNCADDPAIESLDVMRFGFLKRRFASSIERGDERTATRMRDAMRGLFDDGNSGLIAINRKGA